MIDRYYGRSIMVDKPNDYFERWYADVWHRHFSHIAKRDELYNVLDKELKQVGATLNLTQPYEAGFHVTFPDDRDYILFVLRWA